MIVGFVPARGGSQRVPNKNLAEVGEHTLVGRAVLCAFEAGCAEVVVSTDSEAIGNAARWDVVGIEEEVLVHRRSPQHATDTAQIEDAIADWMHVRPRVLRDEDVIVLLQPTSPFRRAATVRACIELVAARGYDSALSISLAHRRNGRLRSHEDGALRVIWNSPNPLHRPRSQDVVQEAYENGAVYAFTAGHFRRTRCRMGGREAVVGIDWLQALEIDTPEELALAQAIADRGLA